MALFDFLGDLGDLSDWLVGGATVGSALIGANAANKAADANAQAAAAAGNTQREMFYQNRSDTLPYLETGTQSLYQLADLYGIPRSDGQGGYTTGKAFEGTPGYGFRMAEGIKALDRSAASRGRLNSGAQDKALMQYGQNLASEEWGNYTNALRTMAGIGQTANNNLTSAGSNAAANIGQTQMAAGQARGSAYTGTAQAANQGIGNALYWYSR